MKHSFAPIFGGGAFLFSEGEVERIKKRILPLLAALCLLLTACAVKGNALPDGMDEDALRLAGLAVVNELCTGEYESVYDALREDVREAVTAEEIGALMDSARDGLGEAGEVTDTLVTGVTDAEEEHAIVVIRRKFDKKSIYFRVAFDTDMQLIGLEIKKK